MSSRAIPAPGVFPSPGLSAVLAAVMAVGVFLVDTVTPASFAVAVLYGVVVLLAGNRWRGRALVLVAMGCVALTLLSFGLTHALAADGNAVLRCLVSLAAIAVTTLLVRRNHAVTATLARQREELQLIIDWIPALVWTSRPDRTADYVSARWEESGYSRADFHADWRRLTHPDDLERVSAERERSRATGEPLTVEHRLRRKDGSADPYSAGTFVDARGRATHLSREAFSVMQTCRPGPAVIISRNEVRGPWTLNLSLQNFVEVETRVCRASGSSQVKLNPCDT